MFKFILTSCFLFTSFAAFARYPEGACGPNDTKLVFESQIVFGNRAQLFHPLFCANGNYYALLAFSDFDGNADHTDALCGLLGAGKTVDYETRLVDHERLASFDQKGRFGGVIDHNKAQGFTSHAVRSLTCETGP